MVCDFHVTVKAYGPFFHIVSLEIPPRPYSNPEKLRIWITTEDTAKCHVTPMIVLLKRGSTTYHNKIRTQVYFKTDYRTISHTRRRVSVNMGN